MALIFPNDPLTKFINHSVTAFVLGRIVSFLFLTLLLVQNDNNIDRKASVSFPTQFMLDNGVTFGNFAGALAQYTISSVGMMLGNKLAVGALPLPCTLTLIQVVATLILLYVLFGSKIDRITQAGVREWAPIAALFTAMMVTSMLAFAHASVSAILIFRNVGAIVTSIVEYKVRGIKVSKEVFLSEVVIVVGAVLYGWKSASFEMIGLILILLNVVVQVWYGVLLKRKMDTSVNIREMSKFTMSAYNNLLAVPALVILVAAFGEPAALPLDPVPTPYQWGIVGITCILGFMISTSGFGLQKIVSATAFLIINNCTKFLNIALGMIFLQDRLLGITDTLGCVLAFSGGLLYSYVSSRQQQNLQGSLAAAALSRSSEA